MRVYFSFFLFFVMVSSGVVWAQGVITLPETGQTKCYDANGTEISCSGTGQDGEWRAGVEWPNPRFSVSDDCVTDNLTGLMWAKNAYLANYVMTWQEALDYVASINSDAGLCGYKDWRLPNVNELESLVNAEVANFTTWLNSQGFVNVQSYYYWSSTTDAYNSVHAWVVIMLWSGNVYYYNKSGSYCVWPVRSGQGSLGYSDVSIISNPAAFGSANVGATSEQAPAQLWETGQTSSYAPGDDGDLERGVSWPTLRFTDHGDGTVTDKLTGLM
jgi:hypothetical protein